MEPNRRDAYVTRIYTLCDFYWESSTHCTCYAIDARPVLHAHRVDGPAFESAEKEVGWDSVRRSRSRGLHGRDVRFQHRRVRGERIQNTTVAAALDSRFRERRLPHGPLGEGVHVVRIELTSVAVFRLFGIKRPIVFAGRRMSAPCPTPDHGLGNGVGFFHDDQNVLAMLTNRNVFTVALRNTNKKTKNTTQLKTVK